MEGGMPAEDAVVYLDPIVQDHVIVEQTTSSYVDPLNKGKLIEKQTTSLTLETLATGCNEAVDEEQEVEEIVDMDSPTTIFQQCAQRVKDADKVENLIEALVREAERGGDESAVGGDAADLRTALDKAHIIEGLVLLDKLESLHTKYALATRKTELLELNLWDLNEKIRLLECKVDKQEQQIVDAQSRQVEQERVLLSLMRNIYLRHFHDQVREGISRRLAKTPLYAEHHKVLRLRVHDHESVAHPRHGLDQSLEADLWRFMEEAHALAPHLFSKAALWNQFADDVLRDADLVALLGLSPESIRITRYGDPGQEEESSSFAAQLRNKYVFAELVTRQNGERRLYYTELYEFLYKVCPESMNFKLKLKEAD